MCIRDSGEIKLAILHVAGITGMEESILVECLRIGGITMIISRSDGRTLEMCIRDRFYTSRLIYSQASAQKISSSPNRAKPLLC